MKLLILFSLFIKSLHCLKVIVYLFAIGKSHLQFASTLVDILVENGHIVDIIIVRFNSGFDDDNGTNKTRRVLNVGFENGSPWMEAPHLHNPFADQPMDWALFIKTRYQLTQLALKSGEALKFLMEEKYDIALVSDYDYLAFILMHQAGIRPIATYNSMPLLPEQAKLLGLPNPVSVSQNTLVTGPAVNSFSFISRTRRMISSTMQYLTFRDPIDLDDVLSHKYWPEMPGVHSLIRNSDIIFVNSNEMIENPRPLSHKVKYIGGVGLPTPKPLDEKLLTLLATVKDNIVLFSFGTQVPTKNLPLSMRKSIVAAFKQLPHLTLIWKYNIVGDEESLFDDTPNIIILPWLPQTDLLNDKRVVAFISHMGQNSFLESSYAGVPIVAIPLFADQMHNAALGQKMGTAVTVSKTNITERVMFHAIKTITHDVRFRLNALRYASLLKQQPVDAKKTFIEWFEYAAANKDLHQIWNLPGNEMSTVEYYCIDCAAFLLLLSTLVLYISFAILQIIVVSFRGIIF